ncbi:hypothetical protein [Cystobacter fuscus]|nr:hypothetical protein [Cystobacter fuscus]
MASMTPSKEDLIAIVRRYYESSNDFLSTAETGPETKRRQALWTQMIENMGPWKAFRAELRRVLPDFNIGETGSTDDGGLRCMVYPLKDLEPPASNWAVVGCVSILAPVYFVYGVQYDYIESHLRNHEASFEQPPPDMSWPAQVVARTIEKMFGFSAVSREIAETPVPLFAGLIEPPETTLFHTLFTNAPSSIP